MNKLRVLITLAVLFQMSFIPAVSARHIQRCLIQGRDVLDDVIKPAG
jgi:hypothetical protein